MSELEELLRSLVIGQLYKLLCEAEELRSKGTLSIEAETRKISEKVFGNSDVVSMVKVHHEVYRYFALNRIDNLFN